MAGNTVDFTSWPFQSVSAQALSYRDMVPARRLCEHLSHEIEYRWLDPKHTTPKPHVMI
jgi:hypothetical protein